MRRFVLLAMLALFLAPAFTGVQAQEIADTVYRGGVVLTMDEANPRAEAVALKDGRILAVGTTEAIAPYVDDATETVDLAGRALIPGFVDAHGHVFAIGLQALAANLLPEPDGQVNSIPALQDTLRAWAEAYPERVEAVDLIIGFGYDDAQLDEQRHPTGAELDAVSTDIPVYIIHQSGHIGVANSAALALAGIDADTDDPPGGVIRRLEGSSAPNGVLEETPHFSTLLAVLRHVDEDGARQMFRAGLELVTSYGYTTAQEGRSSPNQARLMQAVASDEGIAIDVAAYPDILVDRDFIAETVSRDYQDRFRVAGAKLTIDGSPQGFTAWRDRPYYQPPAHLSADYVGYPAASEDQVFEAIDWAYANGIQIITHANGEAASDQLIGAIETATIAHEPDDPRPVLIHGQFLREDQLDAYKALGVFPSLFPMHTFYWGDWHRTRTVGPELAENISPTGWVRARDMMFSTHHDAPVAFPDSMRVLDATVTRRTRSDFLLGPDQRVDVMTALKAMTLWPAYQHFEEDTKGSIEVGKLADLVILSADPTAIDPETLDSLEVVQTIKEGVVVYDIETDKADLQFRPGADGHDPLGATLRYAASARDAGLLDPNGRAHPFALAARTGQRDAPHPAICTLDLLHNALQPSYTRLARN